MNSNKFSTSLQVALLADAIIFFGVLGLSPRIGMHFPYLLQGVSILFRMLIAGGFGVAVCATFMAICERKPLSIALVVLSGFLSFQFAGAALDSGDRFWVHRFWHEQARFQETETWIATLPRLKDIEEIQVDPPKVVRDLATGGETHYIADTDGELFVVLPALISGIDDVTAYIYSFDGQPPTEGFYRKFNVIERLDAHWYLVRTT